MADDKLDGYRSKRSSVSPEPSGEGDGAGSGGHPRFVIQQHDASSEHYDFRIEVDGVLVSWAVPKGPSTDPSEKRLAIRTEDHPLDYADFEGTIPPDEYGGGSVLIWDRGRYRNLKEDDDGEPVPLADQIEAGHLTVTLDGEKLQGGYALTRIRSGDDGDAEGDGGGQWLLVKMDDEAADARRKPTSTEPESVVSGREIGDVAQEEPRED